MLDLYDLNSDHVTRSYFRTPDGLWQYTEQEEGLVQGCPLSPPISSLVHALARTVVKHKDDPDGPTYVYKLEQSDEQDSVTSLSDVMAGKDKMTYTHDHCSIFIDDAIIDCCETCTWFECWESGSWDF